MFRGKSLIIIDDSENIRTILSKVLKKHGYLISTFANAKDTIQFCENNLPDLLIIDFYKTGIDIPAFYNSLQNIPKGGSLPIFCITGSKQDDKRLRDFLPNIVSFFHKPVKVKDLVIKINDFFENNTVQAVPIFNGELGNVDVWKLLKNIEDTGISGHIEVITKNSTKVKFALKRGMLDDMVLMGSDENDPISYLINENEGILTVYQDLVKLSTVEEEVFDQEEQDQVLFEVDAGTDEDFLMELLSQLMKKFIEDIGRQDTLKTFMKVSLKLSKMYPELRLLNVNYKGEVTWEGNIEIGDTVNFVEAFARLVLDIFVEMGTISGEMYEINDFFPKKNKHLEKLNFYEIFDKQLE